MLWTTNGTGRGQPTTEHQQRNEDNQRSDDVEQSDHGGVGEAELSNKVSIDAVSMSLVAWATEMRRTVLRAMWTIVTQQQHVQSNDDNMENHVIKSNDHELEEDQPSFEVAAALARPMPIFNDGDFALYSKNGNTPIEVKIVKVHYDVEPNFCFLRTYTYMYIFIFS